MWTSSAWARTRTAHRTLIPTATDNLSIRLRRRRTTLGSTSSGRARCNPGQRILRPRGCQSPGLPAPDFDYPVPPYTDPHVAVRAGMDFLVNMGDTWLSNTPRRGSVALRTTMQHSETQLCIACHPSQFTMRGYLTAVQNGYAPTQRPALEFIADRHLQQRPAALWRAQHQLGARHLYGPHGGQPPARDHAPMEQNVTHDAPRPELQRALTPNS